MRNWLLGWETRAVYSRNSWDLRMRGSSVARGCNISLVQCVPAVDYIREVRRQFRASDVLRRAALGTMNGGLLPPSAELLTPEINQLPRI